MTRCLLICVATVASGLVGCSSQPSQKLQQSQKLAQNKAIVMRSEDELWSKGNLAAADELYSNDFICHFIAGAEWKGLQGIKNEVAGHRTSFPDWTEKVDDIIAEGDRVVIRFTSTGTQEGAFAGVAPTGRKVTIHETAIYRVVDGKIVEQWGFPDSQSLMQQLTAAGQ